uniref:DEK-C domain-containing protein n=1 Tax=Plectus sambesii TaxID=2011161 RepID=A0A914X3T7_9BILA
MAEPRDPTNEDLRDAIKGILAKEDLSSLSSKKVRKMLEELFLKDLAEKKQDIDQMLMAMINEKNEDEKSDEGEADNDDAQSSSTGANGTNGASSSKPESSDESDDPGVDDSPPRKKQKANSAKSKKSVERIDDADSDSDDACGDPDAAMARKMQKEEMGIRTRNNRRGIERKPKPTKEPKSKAGPRTG